MPVDLAQSVMAEPLAHRLATCRDHPGPLLHWLGQAGFVLTTGRRRLMIDPYLSDSLAEKYRGTATPHDRLMAAPVRVDELGPLDLVLVTHHHTDHMDPATLAPLAAEQPGLRFVVPAASREEARRRIGVGDDRLILMDAGAVVEPFAGLRIEALRAAHETLERDAEGRHRFLGYAIAVPASDGSTITIVHSGDTVPFEGQVADLSRVGPDLLLLPVNGRPASLAARGIAGNLTLEEAVTLAAATGAGALVAHHHGMFAFNTLPLAAIEARAADPALPFRLVAARPGIELSLELHR